MYTPALLSSPNEIESRLCFFFHCYQKIRYDILCAHKCCHNLSSYFFVIAQIFYYNMLSTGCQRKINLIMYLYNITLDSEKTGLTFYSP